MKGWELEETAGQRGKPNRTAADVLIEVVTCSVGALLQMSSGT